MKTLNKVMPWPVIIGLTLFSIMGMAQDYKVPPPFLGPANPQYVDTLVPGMGHVTSQPTFDTYVGRSVAAHEALAIYVARGARTVFQEVDDLRLNALSYCILQPQVDPCNKGNEALVAATKVWTDQYMAWVVTQPLGYYIQGADWWTSIAGTPITKPLVIQVAPQALPLVGECYSVGGGKSICTAPGAQQAENKDGDVVTQDGKKYVIHVTHMVVGISYTAEPQ